MMILITPSCLVRAGSQLERSQSSEPASDDEISLLLYAGDVQFKIIKSSTSRLILLPCPPLENKVVKKKPFLLRWSFTAGILHFLLPYWELGENIHINFHVSGFTACSRKCLASLAKSSGNQPPLT